MILKAASMDVLSAETVSMDALIFNTKKMNTP